jgi:transcription elongation factor Elf1
MTNACPDQSHLDEKYFVDENVYNCPFCNRNNVRYEITQVVELDWSNKNESIAYFVICSSCENKSMHLSKEEIHKSETDRFSEVRYFFNTADIDEKIFYSVPTSFFTIDSRIPRKIRELITEAEGCLKMNYLTGASACTRKAIYELLEVEDAEGDEYDERIKSLKGKHPQIDDKLFDVPAHIKDMASDKVHEASWGKWDSDHLRLIIKTTKRVLREIYVIPDERKQTTDEIQQLLSEVKGEDVDVEAARADNE